MSTKLQTFHKLRNAAKDYLINECSILEVLSYDSMYTDEQLMLAIKAKLDTSSIDQLENLYGDEINTRLNKQQQAKCKRYAQAIAELLST